MKAKYENSNLAVTMLLIPSASIEYMNAQRTAIRTKHHTKVSLAAFARGVIGGLCAANVDFSGCRTEWDVFDIVRDLAKGIHVNAASPEVPNA